MGKRRLAYTVRRFHDGIYVLMVVEGGGAVMHELERRLRVTEPVIKFLTVRMDEEQKRLDKIKKLRDAKKKVSAQPAAAAAGSCQQLRRRKLRQRRRREWSVARWPGASFAVTVQRLLTGPLTPVTGQRF